MWKPNKNCGLWIISTQNIVDNVDNSVDNHVDNRVDNILTIKCGYVEIV